MQWVRVYCGEVRSGLCGGSGVVDMAVRGEKDSVVGSIVRG